MDTNLVIFTTNMSKKINRLLYFYKRTFSIVYHVILHTENWPVLYTST